MKCMNRNLTTFEYRAYAGRQEVLDEEKHTGRYEVTYLPPVQYRGDIGIPSGYVQNIFPGINPDYTNVLLMDNPEADINENGLIDWNGESYQILSVMRSLNLLRAALKRLTRDRTGG